jgi:pimaricinolide synthase PimS1
MQALPKVGGMLAVRAAPSAIAPLLERFSGLDIAAINGPKAVVVSGVLTELVALEEELTAKSLACQRLLVSHAFHSRLMAPMLEGFRAFMEAQPFAPLCVPLVSTVTAQVLERGARLDPEYWGRHVVGTVRFSDALSTAARLGASIFLEVGPDATLTRAGRKALGDGIFVASLDRGRPAAETLADAAERIARGRSEGLEARA